MLQFDLHRHAAHPISGLGEIASRYDVILCDVWGVVHNGMQHYPDAVGALARFRERGGAVVLITNAPRPASGIERMLRRLEVPMTAYDAIVSSGDVTVSLMLERGDKRVHHLGPPRDNSLFREVAERSGRPDPRVPFEEADYVVCTGLLDDVHDKLEDYDPLLRHMRERNMEFICANPDVVVHSGERLIYCAGAIAELYRELGGEAIFYGKPHRPIYERAMALATERRGRPTSLDRVLAIGDSVRTDLTGALGFGIDCLFLTRGIHSEEFEGIDQLDPASVKELFGHPPRALMRELRW
jgi:HAD superfamily hydrolase (TIGR01459 family)